MSSINLRRSHSASDCRRYTKWGLFTRCHCFFIVFEFSNWNATIRCVASMQTGYSILSCNCSAPVRKNIENYYWISLKFHFVRKEEKKLNKQKWKQTNCEQWDIERSGMNRNWCDCFGLLSFGSCDRILYVRYEMLNTHRAMGRTYFSKHLPKGLSRNILDSTKKNQW